MFKWSLPKAFLFSFLGIFWGILSPGLSSAESGPEAPNSRTQHSLVDRQGILHSVWVERTGPGMELFYRSHNPADAAYTSVPVRLADSASRIRRPQIQSDAHGMIHVLWQERFSKGPKSRNTEGTWVHYANFFPEEIKKTGLFHHFKVNDRPRALHPSLSVGEAGTPTIVWEEDGGVFQIVRVDSSGVPAPSRALSLEGADSRRAFPTAIADGGGQIHLVWTEKKGNNQDRLVYTKLAGKTLRPDTQKHFLHAVPAALGQRKALSSDGAGRLTLSWSAKQADGFERGENQTPDRLIIGSNGLVKGVIDKHIKDVPVSVWTVPEPAALGKRVLFPLPQRSGSLGLVPEKRRGREPLVSMAIEQQMMRRFLEHSSWSGAPPSAAGPDFGKPFLSSPVLSFQFLKLPSYNQEQDHSPRGLNSEGSAYVLSLPSKAPNGFSPKNRLKSKNDFTKNSTFFAPFTKQEERT